MAQSRNSAATGDALARVDVDRRPYAAELELHSDPDTHAITWQFREVVSSATTSDNGWQPTILMEKVSRWLEEQDEPRSRNQVEGANLGKSRDYIRQAMDTLTAEGYVAEQKGPNRARLLTSIKPFRTSPEFASASPGEPDASSPTSPSAYRRGEVTGEHEDESTLLRYLDSIVDPQLDEASA